MIRVAFILSALWFAVMAAATTQMFFTQAYHVGD